MMTKLLKLLFCSILVGTAAAFTPVNLHVESLRERDAAGIDVPNPLLAWDFQGATAEHVVARIDVMLSASAAAIDAEVLEEYGGASIAEVTRTAIRVGSGRADQVAATATRLAPTDHTLRSSAVHHWAVCVWPTVGERSCSRRHTFVTGLLPSSGGWTGSWIGGSGVAYPQPCTHCMASYHAWCAKNETGPTCNFRGIVMESPTLTLDATKTVTSAVIHATGLGMFALRIGAAAVTDAVLEPGFSTNFSTRVLYSTYDVTKLIVAHAAEMNAAPVRLSAAIGAGKFSLEFTSPRYALIAELHVAYSDGTLATVLETNAKWRVGDSAIVGENLYRGELYDARRAMEPNWRPAEALATPPVDGLLSSMLMPPMRRMERVAAVDVARVNATSIIFDFGKNLAGYTEVKLTAGVAAGHSVALEHGELYYPATGTLVNPYLQNDAYICSGAEKAGDTWAPTFVYHGFRYVVATGLPDTCLQVKAQCLTAIFVHTDMKRTGSIHVGDGGGDDIAATGTSTRTAQILALIHKSVVQTQLSNVHSLPTDCPTREKRGWMGDAQWTAEEASLNFDTSAFYANFLRTIGDVQMKGCRVTSKQYALEPPYHTCCSPTLDQIHPVSEGVFSVFHFKTFDLTSLSPSASYHSCIPTQTIFQCSPMSAGAKDTSGSVPDVVPELWGTGGGRGYPGAPVWASALVAISDAVNARFGARSDAIKQRWPNLVAYMAFNKRQAAFAPGTTLPQYGLLGDWLASQALCPGSSDTCLKHPGFIRGNPTSAFQYILDLESMVVIATALNETAAAAAYAADLAAAPAAYHAVFFNATRGDYGPQQTANMMPLFIGAVPTEHKAGVVKALADSLNAWGPDDGPHPSGGGVGVRWILQALVASNETKLALDLASQTSMPSFGHFALSPPGTFWEGWNTGDPTGNHGSMNHIMLAGGVDPWIYHHACGLRVPSAARGALGFGRGTGRVAAGVIDVGVEEVIARRVGGCAAALHVPGGTARVVWTYRDSVLAWNVTVPFGNVAELRFPAAVEAADGRGGWLRAGDVEGASHEGKGDAKVLLLALPSGTHAIAVTYVAA